MAVDPGEMRRQLTKTVLVVLLVAAVGGLVATATAADSTGTAETAHQISRMRVFSGRFIGALRGPQS